MYKILVIDDNHSFIDSFKVMLKEFPLQVESTYKFQNARDMLEKTGHYKNIDELQAVLNFQNAQEQYKKESEAAQKSKDEGVNKPEPPETPLIHRPPFNPDGYAFVIVEYDTESGIKAPQFIQEIIRGQSGWQTDDFVLLTTKLDSIESSVRPMGLTVFEKPLKQSSFKNLIQDKIQQIKKMEEIVQKIMDSNGIKITEKASKRKSIKAKNTGLLEKAAKSTKKK